MRPNNLPNSKIQVYPVLMDDAALRAGGESSKPSGPDLAVERLMDSVAVMTGGRVYRLTQELGFADILLDAFDLGTPIRGDVVVSRHDWAIVAVGAAPASLAVAPSDAAGARKLALDDSLEAASGIRASILSAGGQRMTILRRPGARDLVDRFWQGRWTLGLAETNRASALRLYRIPDCLVQLEMSPELPWWLNEQVQLQARLLDRHQETPEAQSAVGRRADGGCRSI